MSQHFGVSRLRKELFICESFFARRAQSKSVLIVLTFICNLLFINSASSQEVAESSEPISEISPELNAAQQVKFNANDGFLLVADYYLGKKSAPGVLMLHDCSHDNQSYMRLGKLLAERGIHALALDLRGFGLSESATFSHKKIKSSAQDIISYQTQVSILTASWEEDVHSAYKYLRQQIGKDQDISIVTSGCSAFETVKLAKKVRLKSFVMLAPIMDFMEKEQYKNLIDIPVYFVGAAHHADSYLTTQELFAWNGDNQSSWQVFKGNEKGHDLLKKKKYLAENIAAWLNVTLNN